MRGQHGTHIRIHTAGLGFDCFPGPIDRIAMIVLQHRQVIGIITYNKHRTGLLFHGFLQALQSCTFVYPCGDDVNVDAIRTHVEPASKLLLQLPGGMLRLYK